MRSSDVWLGTCNETRTQWWYEFYASALTVIGACNVNIHMRRLHGGGGGDHPHYLKLGGEFLEFFFATVEWRYFRISSVRFNVNATCKSPFYRSRRNSKNTDAQIVQVTKMHSFILKLYKKNRSAVGLMIAKGFLVHYEAETVHFLSPAQCTCVSIFTGLRKLTAIPQTP